MGIKTPTVPGREYCIVTPEEFDAIYAALPDAFSRLLVETVVDRACPGEIRRLRVHDLDTRTGLLVVSHAAAR